MKAVSVAFDSHLSNQNTSLATCWRATLTNGTVYGFTDHDRDLPVDSVIYQAAGGYTATDVETSAAMNVDNLEVHGILNSVSITEDDLNAGLWDYAAINIFQVNWSNLSQGIMHQRVGTLGEVSLDRDMFRAELRGIMQAYSRTILSLTSPGCRYVFGDSRCKFPIASVTFTATILSVDADNIVLTFEEEFTGSPPSNLHDAGYYDYGLIRFTSGLNIGREMEIKSHIWIDSPPVQQITLQLPMPYPVNGGSPTDTVELVKGCAKRFEDCQANDNAINFGGEPHVPGFDQLVQIARHA